MRFFQGSFPDFWNSDAGGVKIRISKSEIRNNIETPNFETQRKNKAGVVLIF